MFDSDADEAQLGVKCESANEPSTSQDSPQSKTGGKKRGRPRKDERQREQQQEKSEKPKPQGKAKAKAKGKAAAKAAAGSTLVGLKARCVICARRRWTCPSSTTPMRAVSPVPTPSRA